MCGIVGYTGSTNAPELLLDALKKLEYRGYDSAGLAICGEQGLELVKAVGEIKYLEEKLRDRLPIGTTGIAHTRWATHGVPSERNAHPHLDCHNKIAVVHNGIIENYQLLREELISQGHHFHSETDTEVIVHLIESYYEDMHGDEFLGRKGSLTNNSQFLEAVQAVVPKLKGAYAMIIACSDTDYLVGVREKSPLVIGRGSGENFFASDVSALLKYTSEIVYINDGEIVKLGKDSFSILDSEGSIIEPKVEHIQWSAEDAQKGGYDHFMLKEIHEQVDTILSTFMELSGDNVKLDSSYRDLLRYLPEVENIQIVACGTSYNAGMVGKYFIEQYTGIPVVVTHASEYRYSSPLSQKPFIIGISQSGETADTLAGIKEAKRRGSRTLAIANVVGSTITREAEFTVFTRAGPEIGVAATKTFTAQIMVLFMLSLQLVKSRRHRITLPVSLEDLESSLHSVPRFIQRVLGDTEEIQKVARFLSNANSIFYIGRNINFPTAVEGALKIKEISYIHAEAYPAGELKHGPLALLSPETPVVAIIANDHVREKVYSNIGEVCAREAPVVVIAEESDEMAYRFSDHVLTYPSCPSEISPLPISVLLQLLAYYTAKERGCPIDKPRNLAKSVTVE